MDKKDENKAGKVNQFFDDSRFKQASESAVDDLYHTYDSGPEGLNEEKVDAHRDSHGKNVVVKGKKKSAIARFVLSFVNPFTLVLLVLAAVSFLTDYVLSE